MSEEQIEELSDEAVEKARQDSIREMQEKYHKLKLEHRKKCEEYDKVFAALDVALERLGATETMAQWQMHQLDKKLRNNKKQGFKEISEQLK